jgi:hypothetical protein
VKAGTVSATREGIAHLLANNPTPHALKCRANLLQRVAEDSARFYPRPALQQSLLADATMLRARAKR